jgi:hypothetical protein
LNPKLQDLGLEQYVPAFRDNDIDSEVLLMVALTGHRQLPAPRHT